jgi:hypothetical protein
MDKPKRWRDHLDERWHILLLCFLLTIYCTRVATIERGRIWPLYAFAAVICVVAGVLRWGWVMPAAIAGICLGMDFVFCTPVFSDLEAALINRFAGAILGGAAGTWAGMLLDRRTR